MITSIDLDAASELAVGYSMTAEDNDGQALEFVHDEVGDQHRWSIWHQIVFRHDGDLYGFDYEEPATEYQETSLEERFESVPVPVYPMGCREVLTAVYFRTDR